MNHRIPVILLSQLSLLALPVYGSYKAETQSKPNILWITIEDTSPQFIGCYGNKNAKTPVIDKLAKEGVRFSNAFSTGTVCSPSRTAIITGVKTYITGTGNHRSKYPIPEFMKGFPWYLQNLGYYTSNNQKTDYNVASEKEFIQEAWNESSGKAGWWNRKPGQPFFAVFNFMESHQSRTMTGTYEWYRENVLNKLPPGDRIGDNDFELPPFYRESPEMRKQFARVYNSIKLTDNRIGELLERLEKDHLTDSTIIFFFADHGEGMPRGKTNGINYGYRVPFVIRFPEMYKNLSPWGTGGIVCRELIDFTDLAPTLISLAGGEIPDYMSGKPFLGHRRTDPVKYLYLSNDRSDNGIDMVRTITDGKFVYSRNFLPFMDEARYIRYMEIGEIKQQMRKDLTEGTLNPLQKSFFQPRPAEFLFDIENDLWETRNRINDPEYSPMVKKMRQLMKTEVLRSRDIMFLPEYETVEVSKKTTAYDFRLNKTQYPIEKIYQAASLSGYRGKDIIKKQVDLLKSPDKIVRYWAVLGLRSQSPKDLEPYRNAIAEKIHDEYLPVAVTASAISFGFFNSREAEQKLKECCLGDNPTISLMAINYLIYTGNKTPFIETIRKVRELPDRDYNVKAACMDFLGSLGLMPNNPEHEE